MMLSVADAALGREPSPSVHPHRRAPVHPRKQDRPIIGNSGTVTTRALAAMTWPVRLCVGQQRRLRRRVVAGQLAPNRQVSAAQSHGPLRRRHATTSWPTASSFGLRQRAPPGSCRKIIRVGHHPIGTSAAATRSAANLKPRELLPPAGSVRALTAVIIMTGPAGAAAEIPVSAASAVLTGISAAAPAGPVADQTVRGHGLSSLVGQFSRLQISAPTALPRQMCARVVTDPDDLIGKTLAAPPGGGRMDDAAGDNIMAWRIAATM